MNTLFLFTFMSMFYSKGGVGKCTSCPPCMVCDQLIGCVYDNFTPCVTGTKKGVCLYGTCNTAIASLVKSKPPVCKTYSFNTILVQGVSKTTATLINDINGLSCTQVGNIFESVCIKGICTPYTIAIDKLGRPSGCNGLPDGFMCDTNAVFTDGETCINQKCVMPTNPQSLCTL